jgi:putative transposase
VRDQVVDFVDHWATNTDIKQQKILRRLGLPSSKYYDWEKRYGQKNQHNARLPQKTWITGMEKEAIISYHDEHPEEGYRRLSYRMLDENKAAVSPSSVYRVLKQAGKMEKWAKTPSKKGKGFNQPDKAHQHWHIDISYINIRGTFYYLCTVLDGYSRYVVHWEIREQMTEKDVEIILQRATEKIPDVHPRIISDNGPQFVARAFKEFVRISGMTHVRTSPYYPQSNGKLERWHGSLKQECIRPKTPLNLADARQLIDHYVIQYNCQRLHSAIGYVTPKDKLEGREMIIFAERKRKLKQAREWRKATYQSNLMKNVSEESIQIDI